MRADLPLARIGEACRNYSVSELAVFGSAVRNDFGPHRVPAEAQVVCADAA
jgi:predicted nucleotidyltransferase